jgi:hypothetical protein
MKTKLGRLNRNKGRIIFVASGDKGFCPIIAIAEGANVKFRDDYCGQLRIKKSIVKALFR